MDIMELGAIGELVGGLAVIGSLLYVGFQVRQSNQINRAESVRAFMRDYNTLTYRMIEYEEVYRRGAWDWDSLSNSEKQKVNWLNFALFNLGAGDAIASPERTDALATFVDRQFALVLTAPGFSRWWSTFRELPRTFAPNYVERIERVIQGGDLPDIASAMPWAGPERAPQEDA